MRFGKLVDIVTGDQRGSRIDQRPHRQLHDIVVRQQRAMDAQFVAMNDVLGVVEHDRGGMPAFRRLLAQQRLPQPIEAIRLGRRPGPRVDDNTDAAIAFGHRRHHVDRRAIVGVDADIQPAIVGAEAVQRRRQHRADHRRFVPGRDKDGQPAAHAFRQIDDARFGAAARPPAPIHRVEREVVDPAHQETDRSQDDAFARHGIDRGRDEQQRRSPRNATPPAAAEPCPDQVAAGQRNAFTETRKPLQCPGTS